MAQWGNTDDAANSVIWASAQVKETVNTSNQTALFNNTTQDDIIDGVIVGQFGADVTEVAVARVSGQPKPAHAGWQLRTEGSGGRAGRVQYETLVAMGSLTGDAADDAVLPDFTVFIVEQPFSQTANFENEEVEFTVLVDSFPAGATFAYEWEAAPGGNTDAFAAANTAGMSGHETDTLTVQANTVSDGTIFIVNVTGTLAGEDVTVTSDIVTLTVV